MTGSQIPLRDADGVVIDFAKVSDEDFPRFNRHRWYRTARGYVARHSPGCNDHHKILMHREVLGLPRRWEPGDLVGNHLNFDTTDNRRENLEAVTPAENLQHSWDARKTDECRVCDASEWGLKSGTRYCKPCHRRNESERQAMIKADPEQAAAARDYQAAWARKKFQDTEARARKNAYLREWRARKKAEAS